MVYDKIQNWYNSLDFTSKVLIPALFVTNIVSAGALHFNYHAKQSPNMLPNQAQTLRLVGEQQRITQDIPDIAGAVNELSDILYCRTQFGSTDTPQKSNQFDRDIIDICLLQRENERNIAETGRKIDRVGEQVDELYHDVFKKSL